MPDGAVMTESAAITLHLADLTGRRDLVPAPNDLYRQQFLRWLVFLATNSYPTFTYADDPARFVTGTTAQKTFRQSVDNYAKHLWQIVELEAGAPWFLGEAFSAIDIYIAVMRRWRPRRPWFAHRCPKLVAIALATDSKSELAPLWVRNFSGDANSA
jgi:GST-like protein